MESRAAVQDEGPASSNSHYNFGMAAEMSTDNPRECISNPVATYQFATHSQPSEAGTQAGAEPSWVFDRLLRTFRRAVIDGLVVSLELETASDLNTFITVCLKYIIRG